MIPVILVKAILASITVSTDFYNIVRDVILDPELKAFHGPYTFSIFVESLFYRLWLALPVEHPPLGAMITNPSYITPKLSSFFFVLMFKLPLLVADLFSGILIFKIVWSFGLPSKAGRALILWFVNPYGTLLMEMFGTMDILSVPILLGGILLLIRERFFLSGAFWAGASMARFYPFVLFPLPVLRFLKKLEWGRFAAMVGGFAAFLFLGLGVLVSLQGWSSLETLGQMAGKYRELSWGLGFPLASRFEPNVLIGMSFTLIVFFWYLAWRGADPTVFPVKLAFVCLLSYFALGRWNVYYALWAIPFILVNQVIYRVPKWYPILFLGLHFMTSFIFYGYGGGASQLFFIPAYNAEMTGLGRYLELIHSWGEIVRHLFRSVFSGVAVSYMIALFTAKSLPKAPQDKIV